MGKLAEQAMSFWTFMQRFKHGISPMTRVYAKEQELPTLASQTEWPKLKTRIEKEISK